MENPRSWHTQEHADYHKEDGYSRRQHPPLPHRVKLCHNNHHIGEMIKIRARSKIQSYSINKVVFIVLTPTKKNFWSNLDKNKILGSSIFRYIYGDLYAHNIAYKITILGSLEGLTTSIATSQIRVQNVPIQ